MLDSKMKILDKEIDDFFSLLSPVLAIFISVFYFFWNIDIKIIIETRWKVIVYSAVAQNKKKSNE